MASQPRMPLRLLVREAAAQVAEVHYLQPLGAQDVDAVLAPETAAEHVVMRLQHLDLKGVRRAAPAQLHRLRPAVAVVPVAAQHRVRREAELRIAAELPVVIGVQNQGIAARDQLEA